MTNSVQTTWCWVLYEHGNENNIHQVSRTEYEPDLTSFPSHLTYAEITQSAYDGTKNYLQYRYNSDGTLTERNHDENMSGYNRYLRNELLTETDQYAVGDRPISDEMRTYRQALRDLTLHANWPDLEEGDWPVKPD